MANSVWFVDALWSDQGLEIYSGLEAHRYCVKPDAQGEACVFVDGHRYNGRFLMVPAESGCITVNTAGYVCIDPEENAAIVVRRDGSLTVCPLQDPPEAWGSELEELVEENLTIVPPAAPQQKLRRQRPFWQGLLAGVLVGTVVTGLAWATAGKAGRSSKEGKGRQG